MNDRNYNCLSCVHRNICKENTAARFQCKESIKREIAKRKEERKKVNKNYKTYIRNLRRKLKSL